MVYKDNFLHAVLFCQLPYALDRVACLVRENLAHFFHFAFLHVLIFLFKVRQAEVAVLFLFKEDLRIFLADFLIPFAFLADALHMFFIVVEYVLPPIASVECLDIEVMAIEAFWILFFSLGAVEFQVEGFICILEFVAVEKVVEKITVDFLLHDLDIIGVIAVVGGHDPLKFVFEDFLNFFVVEHDAIVD